MKRSCSTQTRPSQRSVHTEPYAFALPYGPTGETTTTIGLGGAFLTASSFEEGVATVRRALDLGVRYFDTSPMYCRGAAQAVVGQALDGTTEPHLLATKLGYFARPERFHSREALLTQFEENLRLLRRDHVDTLQLHEADFHHWWSPEPPALAALRELKRDGRCRFIGITGNTADNVKRGLALPQPERRGSPL